ncbi:MAG: hypothetical protein HRF40_12470, partial [Nitrososphaera sp.]
RFYLLIGNKDAWETSLLYQIWGFSEGTRGLWKSSKVGDYLAFYVTTPIKKIIGFGRIREKYIESSITWPEEKLLKASVWKYRIKFKILFILKNDWHDGIDPPKNMMFNSGRKVVTKDVFDMLLKRADSQWGTNLHNAIAKSPPH